MSSSTKIEIRESREGDLESDLESVKRLWKLSFAAPYNVFQPDDYARNQLSKLFVAIVDGQVASCAAYIDFDTQLCGRPLACAGIAAVATHPTYRRQGLTKKLIAEIMEDLDKREIPLAALWPFSYGFYENLGFAASDKQLEVKLKIEKLPQDGDGSKYKEENDLTKLDALHRQWCQGYDLSLSRAPRRWQRMTERYGSETLFVKHQDDLGYMLITLDKNSENLLVVQEFCYLNQTAFFDGLTFLAQFDSQFDKVRLLLSHGHYDLLMARGVGRHPEHHVELVPGMMSRVAHYPTFKKALGAQLFSDIEIADPLKSQDKTSGTMSIGPGELIQLLSGFYGTLPQHLLAFEHVLKSAITNNGRQAFSVEKY